jgi:hypothetical protein
MNGIVPSPWFAESFSGGEPGAQVTGGGANGEAVSTGGTADLA